MFTQSPPTIWTFTSLHLSGLKGSLQRMQLEYVDVVFANRPDSNTPMEGESANQLCTWITNQLIWVASLSLVLRPQWVYDVGWQCWFMFRGYGLCCFAAGWVHSSSVWVSRDLSWDVSECVCSAWASLTFNSFSDFPTGQGRWNRIQLLFFYPFKIYVVFVWGLQREVVYSVFG